MAALTRRFGVERFALVENAIQDAYVRALEKWPAQGTPDAPERWLARVAHNALVDALRHDSSLSSLDDDRRIDAAAATDARAETTVALMPTAIRSSSNATTNGA